MKSISENMVLFSRLILDLHLMIASEKCDSDEADMIRDNMDEPWYKLSEYEEMLARRLSVDLYAHNDLITGKFPTKTNISDIDDKIKECWNSYQSGNIIEALDILDQIQTDIEPAVVAHLRGICWGALGIKDTELFFAQEAARIDPSKVSFEYNANIGVIV
jgi:hypothetical protein